MANWSATIDLVTPYAMAEDSKTHRPALALAIEREVRALLGQGFFAGESDKEDAEWLADDCADFDRNAADIDDILERLYDLGDRCRIWVKTF